MFSIAFIAKADTCEQTNTLTDQIKSQRETQKNTAKQSTLLEIQLASRSCQFLFRVCVTETLQQISVTEYVPDIPGPHASFYKSNTSSLHD